MDSTVSTHLLEASRFGAQDALTQWIGDVTSTPDDAVNLRWNESTAPLREGKGEDAKVLFRRQYVCCGGSC